MKSIFAAALLSVLLIASPNVSAHSYQKGNIRIGHIWARATPAGSTTTAIYVPLLNEGAEEDSLIGASTNQARKIEIHESFDDNQITKMRKISSLKLEPGKPVNLKPKGLHLMVFGLKEKLNVGDNLPLTLQFEKAGKIEVDVKVEAAGSMQPQH